MKVKDIAWLAGLIEGEGCINLNTKGKWTYLRLTLAMTDKDIIARAAKLLRRDGNFNVEKRRGRSDSKPVYTVSISGKEAIAWLFTLYTFFGNRRRQKVREAVLAWI